MKNQFKIASIFLFSLFSIILCANIIFVANLNKDVFADEEEITTLPTAYCLRDDYFVQTTNQHNQGLCWDFASSLAFTTTVMKSTNQYIDFSEAWVSNHIAATSKHYTPGDGGSYSGYAGAIESGGVVQEQDFNYENSYDVSKENSQDLYSYYSKYADKTIVKNYKRVTYSYNRNGDMSDYDDFQMQVKYHILQEGGFYVDFGWTTSSCTINSQKVYYRNPTATQYSGYHALCIVGWDDDITIIHEDIEYKGAWIFLNSWGNTSGNEGVYYLLYEDPNAYYFQGWEYVEEKDDLYLFNKLENSSAQFSTNLKNAYTGTFDATTAETKQKNIFYNTNHVELEYTYSISENTTIDSVEIYKNQTNITNKFDIDITDNSIHIYSTKNLEIGAYKVIFNYSNQTDSEWISGAFYILNGTETEFIYFRSNPVSSLNTSRYYFGISPMQNGSDEIVFATETDNFTISFDVYFATYSNITEIYLFDSKIDETLTSVNNNVQVRKYLSLSYRINLSNDCNYKICLVGADDTRTIDLVFLRANSANDFVASVNYQTFGGSNSSNHSAVLISEDENVEIKNPTKDGYGFQGWYYDEDFNQDSMLLCQDGKFYVEPSRVISYDSDTVYWLSSDNFDKYKNYVFKNYIVYAKWIELESDKTYQQITVNVSGNGHLSEEGYVYVEEETDKLFTIQSTGYIVTEIEIDDNIYDNSEDINEFLENGIKFFNVQEEHFICITFVARDDTMFKVYHYKQSLTETEFVFDDICYDEPEIEIFYGTTDAMTDAEAKEYAHFECLEFSQQKIMFDGSTVINIFYMREVFNVKIVFDGVRFDSEKYDIDEDFLFESSKTYNLCPKGYSLKQCTINNSLVVNCNEIEISRIDCDYNIVVEVEEKLFDITLAQTENGRIVCEDDIQNISDGDVRIISAIADDGYVFKYLIINGEKVMSKNGHFVITVDKDFNIEAQFEFLQTNNSFANKILVLMPVAFLAIFLCFIIIKNSYLKHKISKAKK